MKLTITNVTVTKTSEHSDYALACTIPAHNARYHIWLDGKTRRIRNGVGLDRAEIHKNPVVDKGEQGWFKHHTCKVDSVFGRTLIELMLTYADSNKLFDKADNNLVQKVIIRQTEDAQYRKIARMRDHAEQMYELLKNVKTELHHHLMPSEIEALESLFNEIDNDVAQTSNETP